jgi:hypothetical protein
MNESGQFETPEASNESALADINAGFNNIGKLAHQRARGANVDAEIKIAKEAIYQRVAKEIEALEKLAVTNEFGNMDPDRFEQTPWDKFKKGI